MDSDLRLSTALIGLITGAGQFAGVLSPLVAPRLAARYGHAWLLTTTTFATALSLLPLALLPHWSGVTVGSLGITALAAVWMPAFQVFQMELVDARWRGLAYGIVSMAMSLTYASASLFGGRIAAQWGYGRLFLLAVGLSLLGALVIWGMRRDPAVVASGVRGVTTAD
jgi:MFS family permease